MGQRIKITYLIHIRRRLKLFVALLSSDNRDRNSSDRFHLDLFSGNSPVPPYSLVLNRRFLCITAHLGSMVEVSDARTRMLNASDRS